MTLETKVIPNLIQGVSQQASAQRRDSQCDEQFDCINSPKDGCVSRHGADLIKRHSSLDLTNGWFYELFRANDEHYLATINGGVPRVFNLQTGDLCSVTNSTGDSYVNAGGQPARDNFCAQTVDDFTFIASRVTAPALASDVAPTRPKEAIVFFRAGAYLARYTLAIIFDGTVYRWTYTTPDNSAPANANYIRTTQLAATMYRAITGSGADIAFNDYGVGSSDAGDTGGSGSGTTSAVTGAGVSISDDLGFIVAINGNLLYIARTDGQDFEVDTSDSIGDTYLTAIKDNVRSLSELPKNGFEGFAVQVRSTGGSDIGEDSGGDFWVHYVRKTASSGYWQERPAPGVLTTLSPSTMPHALVNTGPNAFDLRALTWSNRIAGDGVFTARNPGFVGKTIRDLFYHKRRLGILTEATADWSKARNPFTFFPDTVQTVLADAPIGDELAAAETIALLRRALQTDEGLFLWAQRAQFRVHSGQDPFRQDTIQADPAMAYEFAEASNFPKVGTSVYFATEPENYASVRNLQFQNGRAVGDIDITDHVSEYIPAGVRRMGITDTGKLLMVQTDGSLNRLYVYNFLTQDRQIVQSAWNTWRLPEGRILWSSIYRMAVYVGLQRADGFYLLRIPLRSSDVDPGGEYRTRLDLRVSEAVCTVSYNSDADTSTVTLPYSLYSSEVSKVVIAMRAESADYARGRVFERVSASGNTVVVKGNLTGCQFYAGLAVSSERKDSEFFLRGPNGVVPTDTLMVREYVVNYDRSGYFRVEVGQSAGRSKTYELKPGKMGQSNLLLSNPPPLMSGALTAAVDQASSEVSIRLVNDSILPSRWQTAEYRYEATLRAKPSRVRNAE